MKATTALQTNDGMKATTANDGVKGGSVHGEVDAGVHIDKGACVHGDKAVGLHRSRLEEGRSRVAEGRRRPVAAALRHLGHAAGHIVVGVHGGRRPWQHAGVLPGGGVPYGLPGQACETSREVLGWDQGEAGGFRKFAESGIEQAGGFLKECQACDCSCEMRIRWCLWRFP